jgi:hypothetical protein
MVEEGPAGRGRRSLRDEIIGWVDDDGLSLLAESKLML